MWTFILSMIFITGVSGGYHRFWRLFNHIPIFIHFSEKFVLLKFLLLFAKDCIYVDIFLISIYASNQINSSSMDYIEFEILSCKGVLYLYVRDDHPLVHIFQKVRDSCGDIYGQCLHIYQMVQRPLADGLLCL